VVGGTHSKAERESCFGLRQVELINDFVAQGYGMLTLADDEAMYNYVKYMVLLSLAAFDAKNCPRDLWLK